MLARRLVLNAFFESSSLRASAWGIGSKSTLAGLRSGDAGRDDASGDGSLDDRGLFSRTED